MYFIIQGGDVDKGTSRLTNVLIKISKSSVFFFAAWLVAVSAWSQNMPYADQDFSCVSQADADRYVRDFNIDVNSFGGKELCDSKVDTKKLFNDLYLIENGQFKAGDNLLIKNFVGPQYYPWLKSQTRGVERGQDIPWATAYNSGGYFTMQDGWSNLSTLGRVGTFIHEARHTAGYMHIACNQGPYKDTNLAGCDSDYSYGGSHAVEMEYYARVTVQGTNFHPVYKKMARLMAIARANFVFNTPVIRSHEALLALTANRQSAELFDGTQVYRREVPSANGLMKRTSYGAVLFDGVSAFCIELYQNSGFADKVSDAYSYFKLLFENHPKLKDFNEWDKNNKRYVAYVNENNKIAPFVFRQGSWGQESQLPFNYSRSSTAIPEINGSDMYLISDNGQVFTYDPESGRVKATSYNWDTKNKDVVHYKNQNMILRQDGKIYVMSENSLTPWVQAQGTYDSLVTVPVYDSFDVVKE